MHDRHAPRQTWYKPSDSKKGGGGKANWGRDADLFDETDIPLYEPFVDPGSAWFNDNSHAEENKIRV